MNPLVLSLLSLAAVASAMGAPVRGVVKSVDPKSGLLTLEREGTRETVVAQAVSGDLIPERVGATVAADLRESEGRLRFEKLVPADAAGEKRLAEAAAKLAEDTRARGRAPMRAVGEPLPEFALRDQFGRVVTTADLKGRPVVVSFIFTRCRAPKMCPAATRRMVELSKQLKAAGVANAALLSVSFDPEHDTPGVLKTYADGYAADFSTHRFLTGPKGAIDDLRRQFGILAREADGTIVHNSITTVAGPDGRILASLRGPDWKADAVLEALRKPLEAR